MTRPLPPRATRPLVAPPPPMALAAHRQIRFCFQCGAVVPPWRATCAIHDRRAGQGLPPRVALTPLGAPATKAVLHAETVQTPIVTRLRH
jgi:hypothetical protein